MNKPVTKTQEKIINAVNYTYNNWNLEKEDEDIAITHQRFLDELMWYLSWGGCGFEARLFALFDAIDEMNEIFLGEIDVDITEKNLDFARNTSMALYGDEAMSILEEKAKPILERLYSGAVLQ